MHVYMPLYDDCGAPLEATSFSKHACIDTFPGYTAQPLADLEDSGPITCLLFNKFAASRVCPWMLAGIYTGVYDCVHCTGDPTHVTCADLQMRLKALGRHGVGQNDIFQSIAELPLHQAAVLLQLRVQQVLNLWRSRLLHLQPHDVLAIAPSVFFRACL